MAKRNSAGKTWKEHAAPLLRKALQQAARTWKPKSARMNPEKIKRLQAQRARINNEIRKEREK